MKLPDLPNELLLIIGESIDEPETLCTFLRTSAQFYTLLRPVLIKLICSDVNALLTALHWSAARGDVELFKTLCKCCPPLQLRIMVATARYLGLGVRQRAVFWSLPKFTVTMSTTRLIEWVMRRGLRLRITTSIFDGTAIEWAVKKRNKPLLKLLLEPKDGWDTYNGNNLETIRNRVLHDTIWRLEDVVGARFFLDVAGDLSTYDGEFTRSLFVTATQTSSKEVVSMLLEKGASINKHGPKSGKTSFFAALECGRGDMARFLMDEGADIFISPRDFNLGTDSTLHVAARVKNIEMTKILLQKGADVNTYSGFMGTPLHIAAAEGSVEIVRLLLDHGANVKLRSAFRYKAVHLAQDKEIKKLLKDQEGIGKMTVKLKRVFCSILRCKKCKKH